MIASDRDGAITRTDEPERSFGGTTGTSPYWPIPAGVGNRVPAPSPAADEMLVAERDLNIARGRWLARASARRTTIWPGAVAPDWTTRAFVLVLGGD
jgi:hypothetical protein